jgi:midasin (ATPase involved in ribosome maturation)
MMKATSRTEKATEVARCKETVYRAHKKWIKNNRSATLADLRQFLSDVADEFDGFEEDALIADHFGELWHGADYLSEWADPTTDSDEPVTFEYRLANVEEDIGNVEDLIELVGDSFKVKSLQPRKKRAGK